MITILIWSQGASLPALSCYYTPIAPSVNLYATPSYLYATCIENNRIVHSSAAAQAGRGLQGRAVMRLCIAPRGRAPLHVLLEVNSKMIIGAKNKT